MDEQESNSKILVSKKDVKGLFEALYRYVHAFRVLELKYRAALEFAEQHIKSGKPWDQECEKTIGEALRGM